MAVVYLGLGSNLSDREYALAGARKLLAKHPAITIQVVSSLYETSPVGPVAQGAFLNAVIKVQTNLRPESLLAVTQAIESRLGREPAVTWGPRIIDIDILLYGARQVKKPFLEIPHKFLGQRLFALAPLQEVAPELEITGLGPITGLVAALAGQGGVTRLGVFPPFSCTDRI